MLNFILNSVAENAKRCLVVTEFIKKFKTRIEISPTAHSNVKFVPVANG